MEGCLASFVILASSSAALAGWGRPSEAELPPLDYLVEGYTAKGVAGEEVASFEAEVKLRVLAEGWIEIPLLGEEASVVSMTVASGEAGSIMLRRTEDGYAVLAGKKGSYVLKLTLVARVSEKEGERELELPMVDAATSVMRVVLPEEDVEFETLPEVRAEKRALEKDKKTEIIVYGSGEPVTLTWTGRAREEKKAAVAFCEQFAAVEVSRGLVRVDAKLTYSVLQGVLTRFEVAFDKDASLVGVDGQAIKAWDVDEKAEKDANVLWVELSKKIEESYELSVSLEKPLKELEGGVLATPVPQVRALGVKKEKGTVAITARKGLKIEPGEVTGATQVDIREARGLEMEVQELQKAIRAQQFMRQTKRAQQRPAAAPAAGLALAFKYIKRPCEISVRIAEVEAKLAGEVETLVVASLDGFNATSSIRYEIRDAGVFRLKIELSPGTKVIDVRGANINTWSVEGQVLTVDLRSRAEGSYALTLRTERPIEGGLLPWVKLLDCERETGFVAVSKRQDAKVEPQSAAGAIQINLEELPPSLRPKGVLLAYRYIRHPYEIVAAVSKVSPEITVDYLHVYTVREKELALDSTLKVKVEKSGIFELRLAFPQELRLSEAVEGGNIEDWRIEGSELVVNFSQKLMGQHSLRVRAERALEDPTKGFALPAVGCPGVKCKDGKIAVLSEAELRLKTGESENLTEIDVAQLPANARRGALLAYKFFRFPWKLALDAEEIKPVVTCEVFSLVALGEGVEQTSARLDYEILHAGVQEFAVELPKGATNVDWTGENIKLREKVEGQEDRWKVVLQAKVKGRYTLYATFERKMETAPEVEVEYVGVKAVGVDREKGYLAFSPRGNVELVPMEEGTLGVNPIDFREVPEQFSAGITLPIVWAYEYITHPYSIGLKALKHEDVEALIAIAEKGLLRMQLSREGDALCDLSFLVRNTRLQSLDLALPPEARILESFVAGKPVRLGKRAVGEVQALRVPISGAGADERAFPVRVIYETRLGKLGLWGGLAADFPGGNVPIVKLGLELTVPQEYEFLFTRGTLRLEAGRWDYGELAGTGRQARQRAKPVPPRRQVSDNVGQQMLEKRSRGKMAAPAQAAVAQDMLSRIGQGRTYRFERLLAVSDPEAEKVLSSPAYLRVRYASRDLRVVTQVVLVLIVVGAAVLLRKRPAAVKYGAMGGCAVFFTLIAALSERLYPAYVETVAGTAWLMLAALFILEVARKGRGFMHHLRPQPASSPTPPPSEPPVLPSEGEEKRP